MCWRHLFVVAVLLVHPDAARAADPTSPSEAKDLFQSALQAYDAHDYAKALALFQRSYDLCGKAEIRFDIAETYAALGECRQALDELDQLEQADISPALRDRAAVRRTELEPCAPAARAPAAPVEPVSSQAAARARPASAPGLAAGLTAAPNTIAITSSPQWRPGTAWKAGSWTAIGAGAACVIAGLVFEVAAHSAQQGVESVSTWDQVAIRRDERGRTFDTAGAGLLIAGAAAAVTSVVTYVVYRRHR